MSRGTKIYDIFAACRNYIAHYSMQFSYNIVQCSIANYSPLNNVHTVYCILYNKLPWIRYFLVSAVFTKLYAWCVTCAVSYAVRCMLSDDTRYATAYVNHAAL